MRVNPHPQGHADPRCAFTLIEVILAIAISAFAMAIAVTGYIGIFSISAKTTSILQAEASEASTMEQVIYAPWKPANGIDLQTNFQGATQVCANGFPGTNTVTISGINNNPWLRMISVQCVYVCNHQLYTNTIGCIRASD